MTPHIKAEKNDIADIVLMPGDPLRAKWIAENFLEDYKLVNEVRNMYAFTGTYKNKRVTVMGHGMGIPSIGIYSFELFKFYDVKTIIRIGSAGSYRDWLKVKDVFLVSEAYSDSTYNVAINVPADNNVILPSNEINKIIQDTAKEQNINLHVGRTDSSDVFYNDYTVEQKIEMTKSDCVEMEAFALFANAKKLNKKAACILTISDSLVTHESMPADERQTTFKNMVHLALESSLKL
jgi:purine-nucleoside phosphorylase